MAIVPQTLTNPEINSNTALNNSVGSQTPITENKPVTPVITPTKTTAGDFLKTQTQQTVSNESNEYSDTGSYSKGFMDKYQDYKSGLGTTGLNQNLTGEPVGTKIEVEPPKLGEELTIPKKTQLDVAREIGLSDADLQEFKQTGSYSQSAQAKIDAYRAKQTGTSGVTEETTTEPPKLGTGTGTSTIDQQVNDIIKQMGITDPEEIKNVTAGVKEYLTSGSQNILGNEADRTKAAYQKSQELLNAYRTTRDFGLNETRRQEVHDARVQDLKQQYDNAITNQKQKMEADANNMAIVQGTSGRLQSRNMQNAVVQMLDTNRKIYDQLVSSRETDLQRLADDLKYAQTMASNEYNDQISDKMQEMLKNIQALDKTGSLATAQGLAQARSFIDATINNTMQAQSDYYSKLSYISQRFDMYAKERKELNTIDSNVTATMNDGYLYNAQGGRVKDENGTPLKVQGSTAGTLITKEPITLNDGTKAFVYQNTDGTTRIEKIAGTEAIMPDQTAIQRYAQAISSGIMDIGDLQKLGVPTNVINQIVGQITPQEKFDFKEVGGNLYRTDSQGNISLAVKGETKPGKWEKLDDGTYINPEGNIITKGELEQEKLLGNKYLNADIGTNVGIECGQYARSATGLTSTPGGNSLSERIKQFSSQEPVPGGMVLFNGGGYDKTYGHIAVVTGINADGTINIKESNLNGDKKVTERTIPLEGSNISGFYNNTPLAGGTQDSETGTFKTDAIPQYDNYLKTGKVGTNTEEMKAIKEEFGSVENFRKQAEAYNNSGPRQKELDKIKQLKDQVESFISKENKTSLNNSIGAYHWTANAKIPSSTRLEKEAYLANIQNFLDGKTLQQLIDVKEDGATFGALSNEELKMLQNSASKLNQLALREDKKDPNRITGFMGTKENFEKVINETVDLYAKKIGEKEKQMGKNNENNTTEQIVTGRWQPQNSTPVTGRWQGN